MAAKPLASGLAIWKVKYIHIEYIGAAVEIKKCRRTENSLGIKSYPEEQRATIQLDVVALPFCQNLAVQ
jgi:hypothetical protein